MVIVSDDHPRRSYQEVEASLMWAPETFICPFAPKIGIHWGVIENLIHQIFSLCCCLFFCRFGFVLIPTGPS
ncbi:hypothetical protein ACRRTK_001483 [Alexandromys fortis]